jgi:hypothetical protein
MPGNKIPTKFFLLVEERFVDFLLIVPVSFSEKRR